MSLVDTSGAVFRGVIEPIGERNLVEKWWCKGGFFCGSGLVPWRSLLLGWLSGRVGALMRSCLRGGVTGFDTLLLVLLFPLFKTQQLGNGFLVKGTYVSQQSTASSAYAQSASLLSRVDQESSSWAESCETVVVQEM